MSVKEYPLPFLVVLGPCLVLMSVATLFFKSPPPPWPTPLFAIASLLLCWKWRWTGFVVALSTLAIFITMTYQKAPVLDLYWYMGFGAALSAAFIAAILSFEEVEASLAASRQGVESNAASLALAEECEGLRREKEEAVVERLREGEERAASEKKRQSLLQELFEKAKQIESLEEQCRESTKVIHSFDSELVAVVKEKERLHESSLREKEALEKKAQEQFNEVSKALEICRQECLEAEKAMQSLTARYEEEGKRKDHALARALQEGEAVLKEKEDAQQQWQMQLEQVMQQYTQAQEELSRKSIETSGNGNTRSSVMMYRQLREQFEEKSRTLDATRQELFHANEQVMVFQRERDEEQKYGSDTFTIDLVRSLLQSHEEAETEIEHLHDIVTYLTESTLFTASSVDAHGHS